MRYFYELLWFSPEVVEKSEIDVFFSKLLNSYDYLMDPFIMKKHLRIMI